MTASSVNNFPLRPLKTPFAGTALTTANTSTVGGVNVSTLPATGDNVANVATGFPETFSTSITNGGKYLKRADVNALGYIATIMAFRQQMGMPNEWNKQICDAIGGYPKGAVLDYCIWDGTIIKETYKITSLTDDNTEDPTSTAQANWKNWARVSVNAEYVTSSSKPFVIGKNSILDEAAYGNPVYGSNRWYSKSYRMPFDGFLSVYFRWDCEGRDQAVFQIASGSTVKMEIQCIRGGEFTNDEWLRWFNGFPLEKGMVVRFRATQNPFNSRGEHQLIYKALSFV